MAFFTKSVNTPVKSQSSPFTGTSYGVNAPLVISPNAKPISYVHTSVDKQHNGSNPWDTKVKSLIDDVNKNITNQAEKQAVTQILLNFVSYIAEHPSTIPKKGGSSTKNTDLSRKVFDTFVNKINSVLEQMNSEYKAQWPLFKPVNDAKYTTECYNHIMSFFSSEITSHIERVDVFSITEYKLLAKKVGDEDLFSKFVEKLINAFDLKYGVCRQDDKYYVFDDVLPMLNKVKDKIRDKAKKELSVVN